MKSKKQRKAYTRGERKMHLITALAVNVQSGGDGRMTCQELAHALHITASTHLRDILNEMIEEDTLRVEEESDPGIAGFRRMYSLSPASTYGQAIKKAAKQAGQGKETREEREARLMSAINRTNGQMGLWVERQNA